PACTPGTRVEILEQVIAWANTSEHQVYWIGGMAGTGKSTIVKSLCKTFEQANLLAGAFFCSRQLLACREHTRIIPTIADQLARYSHTFAEALIKELQNDRNLADKEIEKQMDLLLKKPWEKSVHVYRLTAVTPVIIIDALDEC
ncbi:hypothetical protein GYMLUDRAFT_144614, partial [Collybiopsis luxurians FD-317 M1]